MPPLVGKTGFDYRFDVASQVMAAGAQGTNVQVIVPLSGPGQDQLGVRVGRFLVYLANREALGSFLQAWGQAGALAEMPTVGESISTDRERRRPPPDQSRTLHLAVSLDLARHGLAGLTYGVLVGTGARGACDAATAWPSRGSS